MNLAEALVAIADPSTGRLHNDAATRLKRGLDESVRPWLLKQFGPQLFQYEVGEDALSWVIEKAIESRDTSCFRGSSEGQAVNWCRTVGRNYVIEWLRGLGVWRPRRNDVEETDNARGPSLWRQVSDRLSGGYVSQGDADDAPMASRLDQGALAEYCRGGQQDDAYSRIAAQDVWRLLERIEIWISRARQEAKLSELDARQARCAMEHLASAEGADIDDQVRQFGEPAGETAEELRAARGRVYKYRERGRDKVLPALLNLVLERGWAKSDAVEQLAVLLGLPWHPREVSDGPQCSRLVNQRQPAIPTRKTPL